MVVVKVIFWTTVLLVNYSYFGYGLLVYGITVIRRLLGSRRKTFSGNIFEPPVTLIVAAYNEEKVIREKIANTLALDYPPNKLQIIFVTDGSTDGTMEIIRQYPAITLLHQHERRGKMGAINRAMEQVRWPFVIFSDANATLNRQAVREIVKYYYDPRVGGVAGEKKISYATDDNNIAGIGESLYWQYESFLKQIDWDLYTTVGAAGELFSIRSELYTPVKEDIILDDLYISLQINMQGYRLAYEPLAYAVEAPSASLAEEQKRKSRIGAGAFQVMGELTGLFNCFRHPLLSFQYLSRRVIRWICPFLLLLAFMCNGFLAWQEAGVIYLIAFYTQLFFYFSALVGWIFAQRKAPMGYLYIPFYFVFMNWCLLLGFIRYLRGNQSVLWEKANRAENAGSPVS
jgi:poly-beta-1,6-N-acetyl-D-glucosamine synthase